MSAYTDARESIDVLRPELIRLFNTLQRQICRVYRVSYESLKLISNTDDEDLSIFKVYSNRKIFELLDSGKLEIDNVYADGAFDIKPRMLAIRHYMTLEEFIGLNILESYPRSKVMDKLHLEPEVMWEKVDALIEQDLISEWDVRSDASYLRELVDQTKQAVEALDEIKPKLRYLQFDVDEDFLFKRDEWMTEDNTTKARTAQLEIVMSPAEKIRQEIADSATTLFTLMHKPFSIDYSQLEDFKDLDSDELLDFKLSIDYDLARVAKKCGLDKSIAYLDGTFRLEPFDMSAADLTGFINFIESNDILYSDTDKYVECKEISDKFMQMHQILQTIKGSIRMYRMFNDEFEIFNADLTKLFKNGRKKRLQRRAKAKCYDRHVEQLEDLSDEFERSFNNTHYHLGNIYSVDSMYPWRVKDLSRPEFAELRDRSVVEIDKVLEKYDLEKDIIYEPRSFTIKPSKLNIFEDMTPQEFIEANMSPGSRITGIAEIVASYPADELRYKIPSILISRKATRQKTEKDIRALEEVIQKLRHAISEYASFRKEIRELNKRILREYRQSVRDRSV